MGALISFLLLFLSYWKHLREEGVIWLMLPGHSLLLSSQLELQQELGNGRMFWMCFPGLNSASLVLCPGTTSLQIVLSQRAGPSHITWDSPSWHVHRPIWSRQIRGSQVTLGCVGWLQTVTRTMDLYVNLDFFFFWFSFVCCLVVLTRLYTRSWT